MKLASLSLALGTAILFSVPATTQAYDPPHRDFVNHRHHYHDRQGLRITSVGYRSPAAYAGLERGDVILEVDGRDVDRPEDLHRLLHRTGSRGVLTVRDARTGRYRDVRVYPQGGHIGVNVMRVIYR